jgi:hypothetical protein
VNVLLARAGLAGCANVKPQTARLKREQHDGSTTAGTTPFLLYPPGRADEVPTDVNTVTYANADLTDTIKCLSSMGYDC